MYVSIRLDSRCARAAYILLTLQTAAPVAEKLDPFGAYVPYKLFRESTRYADGKVVKVCVASSSAVSLADSGRTCPT